MTESSTSLSLFRNPRYAKKSGPARTSKGGRLPLSHKSNPPTLIRVLDQKRKVCWRAASTPTRRQDRPPEVALTMEELIEGCLPRLHPKIHPNPKIHHQNKHPGQLLVLQLNKFCTWMMPRLFEGNE